eukprot:6366577-Prymnesium_polylepis.1
MLIATLPSVVASPSVSWTQSAHLGGDEFMLSKEMPAFKLVPMEAPTDKALVIDRATTYQEILGFGGAFTEAAALNWRSLSPKDQETVIHRYFAAPEDGGLGYTVGR